MNPLYRQMMPQMPQNNMVQKFMQFRQQFRGNPQEQVQQLLNSGKISQAQYDQAVQMANSLRSMMNM